MTCNSFSYQYAVDNVPAFFRILSTHGYKESTLKLMKTIIKHYFRVVRESSNQSFDTKSICLFMSRYEKKKQRSVYNANLMMCFRFQSFLETGNAFPERIKHIWKAEEIIEGDHLIDYIDSYGDTIIDSTKRRKIRAISLFLHDQKSNGIKSIIEMHTDKAFFDYVYKIPVDDQRIIKSYLKYLFVHGHIQRNISDEIIITPPPVKLPTVYSEDEIRKILEGIDDNHIDGIRNKAIILLIAKTGLRSSDVANLQIANISFENNRISIVQKKTGNHLSLLVDETVICAISKYLSMCSHQSSEYVFLNINAPFKPISTAGIRHVVSNAIKAAMIDTSGRKHGPHSLRSSLASAMSSKEISYEVIQKYLGHSSSESLQYYIRIDFDSLRKCALYTLEPSGRFASWLNGENVYE